LAEGLGDFGGIIFLVMVSMTGEYGSALFLNRTLSFALQLRKSSVMLSELKFY
jgi:hypothetical protein